MTRSFWMYCHEDLRRTRRVMALWNYLKQAIELNRDLLQGDSRTLRTPPEGWMPSYSAGTAAT